MWWDDEAVGAVLLRQREVKIVTRCKCPCDIGADSAEPLITGVEGKPNGV